MPLNLIGLDSQFTAPQVNVKVPLAVPMYLSLLYTTYVGHNPHFPGFSLYYKHIPKTAPIAVKRNITAVRRPNHTFINGRIVSNISNTGAVCNVDLALCLACNRLAIRTRHKLSPRKPIGNTLQTSYHRCAKKCDNGSQ